MKAVRVAYLALALSLIVLGAVPPAQAQEQPASGWLERSIEKEAARLAATARPDPASEHAEPGAGQPSNWSRVIALKPGFALLLERRGVPPVSRRFVWADDSELIVLNLDHPHLPDAARRTLLEAASTSPRNFQQLYKGVRFLYRDVRVTPDEILLADQKVAETADIVQRIPRSDVGAIMTPPYRRGSVVGAIGGAFAGGVIGFYLAQRLAFSTNKNAGMLMGLSLVGLPIGGALLGSQIEQNVTTRVIYRAP